MVVEVPDVSVLALLDGEGEGGGVEESAGVAAWEGADGEVMLGFGERVVGNEACFGSAESHLSCLLDRGWGLL
jgi:hypothetical protein